MSLTPEQIQQMNQVTGLNKPATPQQASGQTRAQQILALAKPAQPQSSYLGDVGAAFQSGIGKIGEGINEAKPVGGGGVGGLITGVGKIVGGAAEAVTSPIAPAVGATVGKGVNAIADKISDIPAVQKFANSDTGKTTADVAATVGDYANAAGTIAGAAGLPDAAVSAASKVSGALKAGTDALTPAAETPEAAVSRMAAHQAEVDKYVGDQYTKAIKPSIAGKTAPGQLEKYNANVTSAVKSIVENKPSLSLTDQFGDATGKLPQTIDEFRQAIDQSKAAVFKQYDALQQAAGGKGATVDLNPVSSELQKVASNPVVQDLHPDLAKYAATRAEALLQRGEYGTEEAQTAIANLNKTLDAYYRNPTYETASRASVDALIANQLRTGLDSTIEKAGGSGYAELKAKYGSLRAIEKDVTKRGIVEARQTGGRGLNVGDIVSAEELVRGLATFNPAALTTAAAIKGIQMLRRYYTDPNRAIKLMFEKADSTTQPPSNPGTPSASETVSPTSPETTTVKTTPQGGAETPAPAAKSVSSTNSSIGNKATPKTKRVAKPASGGYVKLPTKPPQEALRTMSDFTDYVAGSLRLKGEEASSMEQEAADLYDKYVGGKPPKTLSGLANTFGRLLEKHNFKPGESNRDDLGRFAK